MSKRKGQKPAYVLCFRFDHPSPRPAGFFFDDGFCAVCGYLVRYDPELDKEIRRKYPDHYIERICIGCARNRSNHGDRLDVDMLTTARYIARRMGN